MKSLLILAVCMIVVVVAKPPPRRKCDDYHDCEEDECCLASPKSLWFHKGTCEKLSALGETCSHVDLIYLTRYSMHCPCQKGLECIPERNEILPLVGEVKFNEKCQVPPETTVAPEEPSVAPTE